MQSLLIYHNTLNLSQRLKPSGPYSVVCSVNSATVTIKLFRSSMSVRVRFAPSPTGWLHIGGLRTALYNYLFARHHGGTFVLRIEDTDQERFVEGAEADILEGLAWAGLTVDEGPHVGGPYAPYRQSERSARYNACVQFLLDHGHAYVAFDSAEALSEARAASEARGDTFRYDAKTRMSFRNAFTMTSDEVALALQHGEPHVVRLAVPAGEQIQVRDVIRGDVTFSTDEVDDQVLLKSDGLPTYHLANVVDDHDMAITHVIRGEEWLPSVPKHLLLYRCFGWEAPQMAHLPLIMSPSGGKLSKRNAEKMGIPVSVRQYREAGYEPEAVVNFLALLGWNPGDSREQFSLEELVEAFSLDRIGKSGALFAMDKLAWFNGLAVRALSAQDLAARALPAITQAGWDLDASRIADAALLLQERLGKVGDLVLHAWLVADPESYDPAAVKKRWKPQSAGLMRHLADALEAIPPDAFPSSVPVAFERTAEEHGVGAGSMSPLVRLSLTGVMAGPDLHALMSFLGRETCARRLRLCADRLG